LQPERFELEYTAEDGSAQRPVMIHKALLGSVERFLSVFIEHTAGRFPVWMAPEQLRIISLNQEEPTVACATMIAAQAQDYGLRVVIDNASESVGKKIRNAELMKVPYTIVVGAQEIASGMVTPRIRSDMAEGSGAASLSIEDFLKAVNTEVATKTLKSSVTDSTK
jgi:threonyl-tRNA synthetase